MLIVQLCYRLLCIDCCDAYALVVIYMCSVVETKISGVPVCRTRSLCDKQNLCQVGNKTATNTRRRRNRINNHNNLCVVMLFYFFVLSRRRHRIVKVESTTSVAYLLYLRCMKGSYKNIQTNN